MPPSSRRYFTLILMQIWGLFPALTLASDISLEHAYMRETLPGMQNGAAYMLIKNSSQQDLVLVGAESPRIPRIEMHQHLRQGAAMAMRPVAKVVIPARGSFGFQPGGYHLMLMGISQPLKVGEEVAVKLLFENHPAVSAKLPVNAISATTMPQAKEKSNEAAHSDHSMHHRN